MLAVVDLLLMKIFLSATMTFTSSEISCTIQLLVYCREQVLVVLCTRCSNDVECAVEILFKPQ